MSERPPPPAPEPTLALIARLATSMETLAAIAVRLEANGESAHPAVREHVARVAHLAGIPKGEIDEATRRSAVAIIRTFFRQASDLLDDPGRAPQWQVTDPVVLESQGRASTMIVRMIETLAPDAPVRRALARDGARALDVGTGVGWLAIELARTFPRLSVVGVDRDTSVLARARANVEGARLSDRVTLREQDAADLEDAGRFDVVWLPAPFLDPYTLAAAARRSRALLAPEGVLVVGMYGDPDPLTQALGDLRAVRSGGTAWTYEALEALLTEAGFDDVAEAPKRWAAPFRLVTAS